MPVLDDRGRLFGKVNLIDAVVGVLVIMLIPVAYLAFVLFRVPIPTITSVQPAQIVENQEATVQLIGEDFRSFLGARVGTAYATFLIQDPMHAEIRVPALPAGTYELALFDEMQLLTTIPDALEVVPEPEPDRFVDLQVGGYFAGLAGPDVSRIQVAETIGGQPGAMAEVLAIGPPEDDSYDIVVGTTIITAPRVGRMRVPAIIRLSCALLTKTLEEGPGQEQCQVGSTLVTPNTTIRLPRMTGSEPVFFLIRTVRPVGSSIAFDFVQGGGSGQSPVGSDSPER